MSTQNVPGSAAFMYWVGILAILGIALYFAFMAADTMGVATQEATGTVIAKEFVPAGMTYTTQVVDGRSYVRAHETQDRYVVELTVDDRQAFAVVDPLVYHEIEAGDRLPLRFRETRLTGRLEVVELKR
jgi:hypothetical protein